MKKFTFGTPEKLVPSAFCDGFDYCETACSFDEKFFSFRALSKGCVLEFPMDENIRVYGFGLQLNRFEHSGSKVTLRCNADPVTPSGETHAPVPFFVTDKGYGIYVDTARYAEFYCGRQKVTSPETESGSYTPELDVEKLYSADRSGNKLMSIFIPVAKGIDIYVIEGKTITDIVSQYNMLSGGGCLVPEWALGVLYRCNGTYNDRQILDIARHMRENDVPCDIIGIEPGWQTHAYSCTYKWNPERFPNPKEFIDELRGMDYHINLWEHAFVHPDSPVYDKLLAYSGDYTVWGGLVPDFGKPEARKIFSDYQYENLVALGVDGFKADECDGSDLTGGWSFPNHTEFPSGLDGEQYHNLFGVLYTKTLLETLRGTPTLSECRSMGALAASYPFVLYSDLYDHRAFVRGTAVSGFSGLLWSPELRGTASKEELIRRVQAIVFSAQCLVNAWNYDGIPWTVFDCEDEVKELFKLRKALVPELVEAFRLYHEKGIPPVRALVMDFTDDENVKETDDEYMFCGNMLVAPIIANTGDEREVYLPEGEWTDFYTGERVQSGRFTVNTKNIPVYRKIG